MARLKFTSFLKNAKTSRTEHNERLAAANAKATNTPKAKALKRILHEEAQKTDNRQMSYTYKRAKLQRLDSVTSFSQW